MATTIQLISLRPEIVEKVKKSLACKNSLQYELNISYLTLQRWLKENSSKLTEATALSIISRELGIPKDKLLTDEA